MKYVLLSLLLLLVTVAGTAYYYYGQITYVPEQYRDLNAGPVLSDEPQAAGASASQQVEKTAADPVAGAAKPGRAPVKPRPVAELAASSVQIVKKMKDDVKTRQVVEVSQDELATLILAKAEAKAAVVSKNVVKVMAARIDEQQVSVEAIVDVKQVPLDKLPAKAEKVLQKILKVAPEKLPDNLFVKVEAKPVVKNGEVGFDDSAYIQVGTVRYSACDLAALYYGKEKEAFIPLKTIPYSKIKLLEGVLQLSP